MFCLILLLSRFFYLSLVFKSSTMMVLMGISLGLLRFGFTQLWYVGLCAVPYLGSCNHIYSTPLSIPLPSSYSMTLVICCWIFSHCPTSPRVSSGFFFQSFIISLLFISAIFYCFVLTFTYSAGSEPPDHQEWCCLVWLTRKSLPAQSPSKSWVATSPTFAK